MLCFPSSAAFSVCVVGAAAIDTRRLSIDNAAECAAAAGRSSDRSVTAREQVRRVYLFVHMFPATSSRISVFSGHCPLPPPMMMTMYVHNFASDGINLMVDGAFMQKQILLIILRGQI